MDLEALPLINAASLAERLPMSAAIKAIEDALRSGLDPEEDAPRSIAEVPSGQLLFMPAASRRYAGVKLVSVAPANTDRGLPRIHGLYLLLDAETLAPLALLDGAALTLLRTPAVSAVAIDRLSVPEAAELVLFGTGPQARGHLEGIRSVRPLKRVGVVGRDPQRLAEFLGHCRESGLQAAAVTPRAVESADVIICCTSSRTPLFAGADVPGHALVVAVGSHEPAAREVDDALVGRASVVVEARSAALREAGDIVLALRYGGAKPGCIAGNLADLVHGRVVRDFARPRFFKSVGMSWEDLVVAGAAVESRTGRPH